MRGARILFAVLAALAVSACMRTTARNTYMIDPQTGQPVPMTAPLGDEPPTYAQREAAAEKARALYSSSPAYAQQQYAEQQNVQPRYAQLAPQSGDDAGGGRGLFTSQRNARSYSSAQPRLQPPTVVQYRGPPEQGQEQDQEQAQEESPQQMQRQAHRNAPDAARPVGGPYVAAPNAYASAPANGAPAYTLDSGDKLRVVVFGQDGISNSYTVDASGSVNLPLIGAVPARGLSPQQLSKAIATRLKQGFVRDPHVSVEVEAYRPFFILGEVANPGQYPYVANLTAEMAVAIAGGFGPRASKTEVELTRNAPGQQIHGDVPLGYPLRPGDTIVVKERWF